MPTSHDVEELARVRIRALRQSLGWSLDDLAERSHLSPSTISRIETGKRSISIDVLLPLARALRIDVASLLEADEANRDVVIRGTPTDRDGVTIWPLSRPTGSTMATKMRIEPTEKSPIPRVHPGHDWFFVLSGTIRLLLGERIIQVETGEAAEFSTMTPHAVDAVDGPAEILMVFGGDGQRAHLHTQHD